MDFIQSAILGLVQGLTEFIPVSSTGHLILARKIMGLDLVGSLSFDAILQLATGLAVLVYFWRDIWNIIKTLFNFIFQKTVEEKEKNILLALIIGTIPAIVLGLLLQDYMDTIFRGTTVVAITLILGAVLFYFAEKFYIGRSYVNEVGVRKGLAVGLFQCLALIPGFSRSGSTISGGLFMGLDRELAIHFSFLLSLPIIFGSGLKKVFDLYQGGTLIDLGGSLFIASIFAFISGFLAIHFLLKFLKNHSLNYFGVYRILLAIVILIWL
jgi:undecaprenyl-diphosphatase